MGCASGTDALWLALAAAHIGPGSAASSPHPSASSPQSVPFCAPAHVQLLSDIDPLTFNLHPSGVEKLLEQPQPVPIRALLPVHLYGQCVDWTAFARLGAAHNLTLIEDAAQAWGAQFDGVSAGALGHLAAFSFYPTKNLSAAGDAGLVTTNDPTLAERVRMLRQHGMRQRYLHDEVGWNARMDGFQGAVLEINLRYVAARNLGAATPPNATTSSFRLPGSPNPASTPPTASSCPARSPAESTSGTST